jgi:uncharacterized protein
MDSNTRPLITRRAAIQSAALLAACGVANGQSPPSAIAKPATRDCLWIPTLDNKFCCGMLHRPRESNGKSPAALLIHDLVGSKDQPHRMLVALAEALAGIGRAALRFDLLGRGDSEGESVDATPQRDIQNARDALKALQQLPEVDASDITVIGLSWGGTLACYLASDTVAVKRVVLISSCPIDNASYKPKFETIDGREVSDRFGSLLSREFYEGVYDLTPLSQLKHNRQLVFMVYGTHDQTTRQEDYDHCKNELSFADINVKAATIEGADHSMQRYSSEKKMIEEVTAWLKQQA